MNKCPMNFSTNSIGITRPAGVERSEDKTTK